MRYLLLLVLCAISHAAREPSTQPAALKLLPGNLQQGGAPSLEMMTASRWVYESPKNILGAGYDISLDFSGKSEQALTITRMTHRVAGMRKNDTPPQRDRVETLVATLHGPILTVDGRPQTFALIGGAKPRLIFNAVVPVGKTQWYCALATEPATIAREFLFDFADDPTIADNGSGSVQLRVGDKPPVTVPISFTAKTERGRTVEIKPRSPRGHQFQWAYIDFIDGRVGMIQDQDHTNSALFEAVKQTP